MLAGRVALCCAFFALATSYPSGAPLTTCGDLTPKHGPLLPQVTSSPFWVESSLKTLSENQKLRLVLNSPDGETFAGFMVQARTAGSTEPIGTFVTIPEFAKAITCGAGIKNTLTHKDNIPKKKIEFDWEPPQDFSGEIEFNTTFVKNGQTFWVGVVSDRVLVKRSLPPTERPGIGISTTKIPIRISTVPNYTPPRPAQAASKLNDIYTGCGDTKLCFGMPAGCEETGTCSIAVAITASPSPPYDFTFELLGTGNPGYVAVALSGDSAMENDNVVECTTDGVFMSKNGAGSPPPRSNTRYTQNINDLGINEISRNRTEQTLSCKFSRSAKTTVDGVTYDLYNQAYFLLLAKGDLRETGDSIGYHHMDYTATGSALFLRDTSTKVEAKSNLMYRLHGALMLVAWFGFGGTGMLLPRYFKKTWVGKTMFDLALWFVYHRAFMVTTWSLSIAGFVIIFVEIGGWYSETSNPHAVLGVITTALCFIQPFAAYFRPKPGTPARTVFYWSHWGIGNLSHLLAVVTIYFAKQLSKAELPDWMDWLISIYVAFYVVMHLIFTIVDWRSTKSADARVNTMSMKDLGPGARGSPDPKTTDAPLTGLRKFLLAVYLIIVIGLTVAMTVIAAAAPIEKNEVVKSVMGYILPTNNAKP